MKKILILVAVSTFAISSVFAGVSNDVQGMKILLKNAGNLQITEMYTETTNFLSDILAESWILTKEGIELKTQNTCDESGRCELIILSTELKNTVNELENKLIFKYNVNFQTKEIEEGYKLLIL